MPFGDDRRRTNLRTIAAETLKAIEVGSYTTEEEDKSTKTHDLRGLTDRCKAGTRYYSADSQLTEWIPNAPTEPRLKDGHTTTVTFEEVSTLEGARKVAATIAASTRPRKIGILNFASAKNEGGGFINGAQAQEESIARSSTIYASLKTETAQRFYKTHKRDNGKGYYSHGMIWSPGVVFFRDDVGKWEEPLEADVVTSPAVNAGVVRRELREDNSAAKKVEVEGKIEKVMRERMGRILYLFERSGVTDVVLGSFGTGVFRNDVPTVGKIWGELIGADGARYARSFEGVFFAVLGHKTFEELQEGYQKGSKGMGNG